MTNKQKLIQYVNRLSPFVTYRYIRYIDKCVDMTEFTSEQLLEILVVNLKREDFTKTGAILTLYDRVVDEKFVSHDTLEKLKGNPAFTESGLFTELEFVPMKKFG